MGSDLHADLESLRAKVLAAAICSEPTQSNGVIKKGHETERTAISRICQVLFCRHRRFIFEKLLCLLNGAHLTNDAMGPTNGTGGPGGPAGRTKPRSSGNAAGTQREATRSNGKLREAIYNRLATICSEPARRQAEGHATGTGPGLGSDPRSTFRPRGTQPRKQHRPTGTRSFARTHARTKRIRFPGWTPHLEVSYKLPFAKL